MKKLLLLHGALGAASDFDPLLPQLTANYHCYAPDLPGHGRSTMQLESFSIAAFAAFLADYIATNELNGCHVFGYSMGGYISTYLETQQPSFASIYTLGTKFIWSPDQAAKEAGYLNPDKILAKVPSYAAALAEKHMNQDWRVLLSKTAAMMLRLGQSPVLTATDYSKILIPVVVALGDQDKMVPLDEAIAIFKSIPNAGLDIIPYTPHPIDKVNFELILSRLNIFFDLYTSSNLKKT